MNIESIFRERATVWLVILLLFTIVILVYSALFMPQGLDSAGEPDADKALTRILQSINTSKNPAESAAAAASFQLVCEQESYSKAIAGIRPAVVFLEVRYAQKASVAAAGPVPAAGPVVELLGQSAGTLVFDNAQSTPSRRIGSGVIVDSNGYVLTNYHVIADAVDIDVTPFSSSKQKFKASVIQCTQRDDLALVKFDPGYDLPEATLGDSNKVEVGDVVLAIGSPFGMEHTVTLGIISDDSRSVVIDGHVYSRLFQTDAAINRGNSGGALVNTEGELIGINTAIFAPTGVFTGVGFAIPVNEAKQMLAQSALVRPKAAAGL